MPDSIDQPNLNPNENSLPDFGKYNYQHQMQEVQIEPEHHHNPRRAKNIALLKISSLFAILLVIGLGIFFRSQIYDYFYYKYFYQESYTDLVPVTNESATIEVLAQKNEMAYALYKDKSKTREDVVIALKLRAKLLKDAFKVYTYAQLTPIIEDPKILAIASNPAYSPYIEQVVTKKGVMDFTKVGLASSDSILGEGVFKDQDVNSPLANKFILYNKDSGEFYNLYSPTLNTDEVKNLSGFIVVSNGILIDDEMLISEVYKINPNESGVLGVSIPEKTLKTAVVIVNNSSVTKKTFNDGLNNPSVIESLVDGPVNKYLLQFSQNSLKVDNEVYRVNVDPEEYCSLSVPKKASLVVSKIENSAYINTVDVINLVDVCDNNFGTGFATSVGKLPVSLKNGNKIFAYVYQIAADRVTREDEIAARVIVQKLLKSMGVRGSLALDNENCLGGTGMLNCQFSRPDKFDIMSSGYNLSTPKRDFLSYLTKDQIKTINSTSDIELKALDTALENVTKAIQIPIGRSPFVNLDTDEQLYYYIENRTKLGIDSKYSSGDYGYQIRLASKKYPLLNDMNSLLIKKGMQKNGEYYDGINKVRIKIGEDNLVKVSLERTQNDDVKKPVINLTVVGKSDVNNLNGIVEIKSIAADETKVDQHVVFFGDQIKDCHDLPVCTLTIDTTTLFDKKVYSVESNSSDPAGNKAKRILNFSVNNSTNVKVADGQFKTEYYGKLNFLGESKVRIVNDIGIDLDTIKRIGLDESKFAVRFIGKLKLTGYQKIKIKSNNPVRVWIDTDLVLNELGSKSDQEFERIVLFSKESKEFKLEYLSDGKNLPPVLSVNFEKTNEKEFLIQKQLDDNQAKPIESNNDQIIFAPTQPQSDLPNEIPEFVSAKILSPSNGSTISNGSASFTWSPGTLADEYLIRVNRNPLNFGSNDLFSTSVVGKTNVVVTGFPQDGSNVYVRLYTRSGVAWSYTDTSYKTSVVQNTEKAEAAKLISPTQNTVVEKSVTFNWNGGKLIKNYAIGVGKKLGGIEYFSAQNLASSTTSITVDNLPQDGTTIYVTLISIFTDGSPIKDNRYSFVTKMEFSNTIEVIVKARAGSNDPQNPKLTLYVNTTPYQTQEIVESESFSDYKFTGYKTLFPNDEIRLEFNNDKTSIADPTIEDEKIDRNIFVESVTINNKVYDFLSPNPSIIYDRSNRLNNIVYPGYSSFGTSIDCTGTLKYNDDLGFSNLKFKGEIFWRGSVRIKDNICKSSAQLEIF